jgi:hypothetical protein
MFALFAASDESEDADIAVFSHLFQHTELSPEHIYQLK